MAKNPQQDKSEQFKGAVSDEKLRLSLVALADKYTEEIRDFIFMTYNNPKIHEAYNKIRNSGIYESGGKSKVHKKFVEFPNAYVYDFVDTVLTALHGPDWIRDTRNYSHELIKPWWVVKKI